MSSETRQNQRTSSKPLLNGLMIPANQSSPSFSFLAFELVGTRNLSVTFVKARA